MPITKNVLLRHQLINECFTHPKKRYWTIDEIIAKAEARDLPTSRRTIELDFETMRQDERLNYKAPIVYCKRNKGFHYSDPDYSIDKIPLTDAEVEMLELMTESFQRFKGAQILTHVEGMFEKLGKVVTQLKFKKTKLTYTPVLFEGVPYSKGIHHFDALYHAILKKKPLLVRYKRFDHETEKEHTFHPYLLKEYKFMWYVLGYNEKSRNKLLLALDRIVHIASAKTVFKPCKEKDLEVYFKHTLGVSFATRTVNEIRLWFSPSQGNYIKTQPLHETQHTVSETTEGLVVTLQLTPNYELLQTLLSFGPEVKVLEPASLKQDIKTMLEKSLRLYAEE